MSKKPKKFCPVKFVISHLPGKSSNSSDVHLLFDDTFDNNINEEFPTCMKSVRNKMNENNETHNNDDLFINEYIESNNDSIDNSENDILDDIYKERDKLCGTCAIMHGDNIDNVNDDLSNDIENEYPVISSTISHFESLVMKLEPSDNAHEQSVTATLLAKIAHIQEKRKEKQQNLAAEILLQDTMIYEWMYYCTISKLPYSLTKTNLDDKLALPDYDDISLLQYQLSDNFPKQKLAYVIVADNKRNELIVSFRGTSDIATALFDAEFRAHKVKVDLYDIWVHEGMWLVAKKLCKTIKPFLEENNKNYNSITICGHSLGAGVAVLLSFILNHYDPSPNIKKVKCFGVATPACIATSNPEFHKNITSLVLGDDIVPRLSFVSIVKLISLASTALKGIPGITQVLAGKRNNIATGALKQLTKSIIPPETPSQLLPAGKLYHLTSIDGMNCKPRILASQPNYFKSFFISPNGWKHHRLDLYRYYLASVITGNDICRLY